MIDIYGNNTCPYCLRAKRVAELYGLSYQWHDVDDESVMGELKAKYPEVKKIPQIWWYDRHIGGYTEFASEVENTIGGYGEAKA